MQSLLPFYNNQPSYCYLTHDQVTYAQVASVRGIDLKHAIIKHAQTLGLLERNHALVKTHLEAATGTFRDNWQ